MSPTFPFDAVVGQDDAKLALRLAAADPRIGGVLLRGQKGSAKTTLARGLAAQLGGAPFVELPLGATEDRVVGTLDTYAALTGGEIRFQPGLLAAADGGVLYVDEINLLADHLVDVLLDVAVSGENLVERDGVSHRHPAHFVLVGSMNPEEGELRPQLLDRFGLCVEVNAPDDVDQRVEAVRRRLAFDSGSATGPSDRQPAPPPTGGPAALPDEVLVAASRLALEVGAEGLRADLTLCRAAAALAGLEGRVQAAIDDLRRVAPLVLAHRRRRGPFDPPVVPPEELQQVLDDALDPPPGHDRSHDCRDQDSEEPAGDRPDGADGRPDGPDDDAGPRAATGDRPLAVGSMRRPALEAPRRRVAARGRYVRDEPAGGDRLAVVPTVRSVAARRSRDPQAGVERSDLRGAIRERPVSRTIVLCFDLSGSMGAPERAAAASGTALGLLTDAYERRDRVALVTFRGTGAEVALSPTSSVEVARNRLGRLATGGTTPLAAGLAQALQVARRSSPAGDEALLVVLTDGRANGAPGELDRALEVASTVRRAGVRALVLDCETGGSRLGLAAGLAEAMGARCVHVSDLDAEALTHTIRSF
ncbi:MAG: ATP-binding protein [Actinobacteria bacterium]|nr:ATP-binding protein [Actinomycetota bacterium]